MYYSKSVFFMLNFNSVRVYLQANYLFLKSYYSATRSPERNHFRHYYSLLRSQRGNQQRCQTSVFKVSKQLFKERKKKGKNLFHFERPSEIEREERQRQKITSFVQISLIEARPNK